MSRLRHVVCSLGATALFLFPIGCGSEPEPVAVERTSLVGKMVVVKRQKPKQYVMTSDGKFRTHGEFAASTGSVRAEEKSGEDYYYLVHAGKVDIWIKADDLIDYDEARTWFDKQLNESPRMYDPYIIRAQVSIETGHPERAIADLNEAAKIKSNATQPLLMRAACYETLGDFAKAQQDYERIQRMETSNLTAFIGKARCLIELDQADRALFDIDRALKVDPKSVPFYLLRAQIWAKKGQFPAAELDFERAMESDAHNNDVYVSRGQYWLNRKEFDKALGDFLKALKNDPEQITAMAETAKLLAAGPNVNLRDTGKAVSLAEKATELTGRKDSTVLDALSIANAAAGQFDEAVKNLKAALDDPMFAKANKETSKKKMALYTNKLPYMIE